MTAAHELPSPQLRLHLVAPEAASHELGRLDGFQRLATNLGKLCTTRLMATSRPQGRPIGFARMINGEMRPSYAQPSTKNVMTIKTETYPGKGGFNELRLDDSAGTMRFDMRAERDLSNLVNNDRTEKIAVDHHREIKQNLTHQVDKNQTVSIGKDEPVGLGKR